MTCDFKTTIFVFDRTKFVGETVVIDCNEYSISRLSSLVLMSPRETLAGGHAFSITRIVNYFVAP